MLFFYIFDRLDESKVKNWNLSPCRVFEIFPFQALLTIFYSQKTNLLLKIHLFRAPLTQIIFKAWFISNCTHPYDKRCGERTMLYREEKTVRLFVLRIIPRSFRLASRTYFPSFFMLFKTALVSILFILELSVLDKSCLELNFQVKEIISRVPCTAVFLRSRTSGFQY